MKKLFCFILSVLLLNSSFSQVNVDAQIGNSIIQSFSQELPKFYTAYEKIKSDKYFKGYRFIRGNGSGTPAKANGKNGIIILDLSFIENNVDTYDDNRLVVVVYHELGHLYYFKKNEESNRNSQDNEKFAFEFSLKKTKELAEKGDCEPLKTGVKFMSLRSQSNNLNDEHVRALKIMVNEPLFESYRSYTNSCINKSVTSNQNVESDFQILTENGATFYFEKNTPKTREQKNIHLYILKDNSGNVSLKMCIQYSESFPINVTDYLVNESIKLHANDEFLDRSKTTTYNSWYDVKADNQIFKIVKSITSSNTPKIKFIGTTGTVDYNISENEKKSIINVLIKYIELTNMK
jgi:hypothetical protein